MKIVRVYEYGGAENLRLEEVDLPIPKANQVLVRIHAIGVNFADIRRRLGKYVEPTPLPFTPGLEVAGVIEEVGEEVKEFKPGDRIVSLVSGGYAEYVTIDEENLIPLPDEIGFEEAAALPLQGLTVYYMLKQMARIKKDETVLIHAAAGGVGTLAIQLAKIFGAKSVIATASSEEKLEIARRLGADYLVNYKNDNWDDIVISHLLKNGGVDIILEMVGGDIFHKSLKCLAPFGRLIVFGRASGAETLFDPRQLMSKNQTVSGFLLTGFKDGNDNRRVMQELFNYMKEERLKVIIGGVYSLNDAAKAHRLMEERATHGKIILKPTL